MSSPTTGHGTYLVYAVYFDLRGLGEILGGFVVDHTASQGSLTYDPWFPPYAVNAGSNTVSVFAVRGDRLALRQVVSSGGSFPVSVAVRGDLVYVFNARSGGSVQGYRVLGSSLSALPGLEPRARPEPERDPGSSTTRRGRSPSPPDGRQLIVTTKANGNDIDVFGVGFSAATFPASPW